MVPRSWGFVLLCYNSLLLSGVIFLFCQEAAFGSVSTTDCTASEDTSSSSGVCSNEEERLLLPECPKYGYDSLPWPKYHVDSACDRASHNEFRSSFNRYGTFRRLKSQGPEKVPTETTLRCPGTVHDIERNDDEEVIGFDAVWIVENTASSQVVVAYVQDGVEYSALNSKITPPTQDPNSILQPGEWKAIFTYEGHTFHVREILEDGNMGRVLLQHRVGLIPVRNRYGPGSEDEDNDGIDSDEATNAEDDDEGILDDDTSSFTSDDDKKKTGNIAKAKKFRKKRKRKLFTSDTNIQKIQEDPEFQRSQPASDRQCNILYVGFRNEAGFPLNGYYSGLLDAANVTTGAASCKEELKFHLGLEVNPNDFVWDRESKTKYEGTFIGHTFIFRLASNPAIIVDKIKLEPTKIQDCPDLKKQTDYIKTQMSVAATIGRFQQNLINSTNTTTIIGSSRRPRRRNSANDPTGSTSSYAKFIVTSMGKL